MSQAFGAAGIFPLDRNRVKPSTGIIDTSFEEEGGLAYIPLLRPALEPKPKAAINAIIYFGRNGGFSQPLPKGDGRL